MKKIKLSIQEVVNDYETCTREDERIKLFEELEILKEKDTDECILLLEEMCKKYIPNFENKVPTNYNKKNSYNKQIILNSLLETNFKEIIYSLV